MYAVAGKVAGHHPSHVRKTRRAGAGVFIQGMVVSGGKQNCPPPGLSVGQLNECPVTRKAWDFLRDGKSARLWRGVVFGLTHHVVHLDARRVGHARC